MLNMTKHDGSERNIAEAIFDKVLKRLEEFHDLVADDKLDLSQLFDTSWYDLVDTYETEDEKWLRQRNHYAQLHGYEDYDAMIAGKRMAQPETIPLLSNYEIIPLTDQHIADKFIKGSEAWEEKLPHLA